MARSVSPLLGIVAIGVVLAGSSTYAEVKSVVFKTTNQKVGFL